MKKFRSFLILCIVHCALCIPLPCISQSPEQFGGIYCAYPVQKDSIPDAPDGFEPVYISHYGRHGSRWPVNPKAYRVTADFFQNQHLAQNLTDEGRAAWKLATLCAGNAQGHLGELTPLGERQHREIAARMASRFPTLFKEGRKVVARSSVEPRCIMSMAAFCESLKDINPRLDIRRHATPGDMAFIHPKTEDASLMNSDDAPWRWEFDGFRDSVALCPGLNTRLFKKYPDSDSIAGFSRALYDIAISVQNIDSLDADLFSLFSPEELKGLWTTANYIQYVGNARSPLSGNSGPECVRPLLDEIIARADEMLNSGEVSVDLRFGHDTDLLRLVSLLGINGYGIESENPWEVAEKWRNFDISPMGANLQLIFYRSKEGEILVHPRLNEFPAVIPSLTPVVPGFYSWQSLKSLIPNSQSE